MPADVLMQIPCTNSQQSPVLGAAIIPAPTTSRKDYYSSPYSHRKGSTGRRSLAQGHPS